MAKTYTFKFELLKGIKKVKTELQESDQDK